MPTAQENNKTWLDPANLWIGNIDSGEFHGQKLLPVTSPLIRASSSLEFHPAGLFSEEIFGQVGTPDRMSKFGYIDLRTTVLHPLIYLNLVKLKAFYGEILSGRGYGKFDQKEGELVRCSASDPDARTGYKWFLDQLPNLKLAKNNSQRQNDRIDLLLKYRDKYTISKMPVMPAGLRDMKVDEAKPSSDSINAIYTSLIHYTLALPESGGTDEIFDGLRYSIQKKIGMLYDYVMNLLEGKFGYFQRKFASRNLALGTRNVISTANLAAYNPNDPQAIKVDEVKVPTFQASKMFLPLVIYWVKKAFFSDVFSSSNDQVALLDREHFKLSYQPITELEKTKFLTGDGIEKFVSLFRDTSFRFKPVSVLNADNKPFFMYVVYDAGADIWIDRSLDEIRTIFEREHRYFDESKIRPLTYFELMYISTFLATRERCATVTRYPVTDTKSTVPCKVHLVSTNPGRKVRLHNAADNTVVLLPEYPIMNQAAVDSLVLHPSILGGLGADFDGNCVSGESWVRLRYMTDWLERCGVYGEKLSYFQAQKLYDDPDGFVVAEIQIKHFPIVGEPHVDKNGALVYDVPYGCYVTSFNPDACEETWEEITTFTVEQGCEAIEVKTSSRKIVLSSNDSMAVFSWVDGSIVRVSPRLQSEHYLIPCMKKASVPFGHLGTFSNGFTFGDYFAKNDRIDGYDCTCCLHHCIYKHRWDLPIPPGCESWFDGNDHVSIPFGSICPVLERQPSVELTRAYLSDKSENFLYGLLCGMLDAKGDWRKCQRADKSEGLLIRFWTRRPEVRDGFLHLLWRLGIRSTEYKDPVVPDLIWITPNEVDLWEARERLRFACQDHITLFDEWLLCTAPADNSDCVPLTHDEMEAIKAYAYVNGDSTLVSKLGTPFTAIPRWMLTNYADEIVSELPKAAARIRNNDIVWEPIVDKKFIGVIPVYDFQIETTKVFQINDGVVVYDTVSANGVLSNEGNAEIYKHLRSVGRYVHPNGKLIIGHPDTIGLTIFNLTRPPEMK